MRLSQDVVETAHALHTYHECRISGSQEYNKFRQHVGRNYKNTRTVMKHIHDHTEAPTHITSYAAFSDGYDAMKAFRIRLDIME